MYMITMKQGEYKTETILIYNLFHMGFKNVVLLTGASGGGGIPCCNKCMCKGRLTTDHIWTY